MKRQAAADQRPLLARSPGAEIALTIRLYPGVHDALIDELVRASRRKRAVRAVYLMTVGLTHELARSGAGTGAAPPPPPRQERVREGLSQDDRAFVTGVLAFGAETS